MLTLTPDEIVELTARVRKSAQRQTLMQLGIPFQIRPDGSPVVLRVAMEAALGYAPKNQKPQSPRLRLPETR